MRELFGSPEICYRKGMIVPVDGEAAKALSGPAVRLLEVIEKGCAGIFRPYQTIRTAKADVEAAKIKAQGSIEISEMLTRAQTRLEGEMLRDQINIEKIVKSCLPDVKEESNPDGIDADWLSSFFDRARLVSDEDMQQIWSRILAGEANSPGSFSKRTTSLVADLSKLDAELFSKICSFVVTEDADYDEDRNEDEVFSPFVYDLDHRIYNDAGCNFISIRMLEDAGLIKAHPTGYKYTFKPGLATMRYFERAVDFAFDRSVNLPCGILMFTTSGRELARICQAKPIPGFIDYLMTKWEEFLPTLRS